MGRNVAPKKKGPICSGTLSLANELGSSFELFDNSRPALPLDLFTESFELAEPGRQGPR